MKKTTNYFAPFSTRVVATNIFMTICVIVIVLILILIAQGYSLGESGSIERSGLLEINSRPNATTIKVDDQEQFYQGNFSKIFSSGTHTISVSKKSYDTWQGDAQVESGLVTSVDWVRLFPKKHQISYLANLDPARFATASPNHRFLLYLPENSNLLQIFDLQSNPKTPTEFNLAQLFSSSEISSLQTDEAPLTGTFSIVSWNQDNNIAIIKYQNNDLSTWGLLNLSSPADSQNLSRLFPLNFTNLSPANDSATKLWALSDNQIYLLDLTRPDTFSPIDDSVSSMQNYKNTLLYLKQVKKENVDHPTLYLYRENNSTSNKLKTFPPDSQILFTLGRYWNKDWLAFSDHNSFNFYSGSFPLNSKLSKTMKTHTSFPLDFLPTNIILNSNQRLIFLSNAKNALAFDLHSNEPRTHKFEFTPNSIWLDHYLYYSTVADTLRVADFDGQNLREILPSSYQIISGSPALISQNYLYFFAQSTSVATKKLDTKDQKSLQTDQEKAVYFFRLHL